MPDNAGKREAAAQAAGSVGTVLRESAMLASLGGVVMLLVETVTYPIRVVSANQLAFPRRFSRKLVPALRTLRLQRGVLGMYRGLLPSVTVDIFIRCTQFATSRLANLAATRAVPRPPAHDAPPPARQLPWALVVRAGVLLGTRITVALACDVLVQAQLLVWTVPSDSLVARQGLLATAWTLLAHGSLRTTARLAPLIALREAVQSATEAVVDAALDGLQPRSLPEEFLIAMLRTLPPELVVVPFVNVERFMLIAALPSVSLGWRALVHARGSRGLTLGVQATALRAALSHVCISFIEAAFRNLA